MRSILLSGIFIMAAGMVLGQPYQVIDRVKLLDMTSSQEDTTYVLNFWATWCSPCVKELPHFEELYRNSADRKMKVLLLSLDFPKQAPERLPAFLEEHDITAPVFLINDMDYNAWIDKVDPSWSGAIPATLIYRGDRRIFLEQILSDEELKKYVQQIEQ